MAKSGSGGKNTGSKTTKGGSTSNSGHEDKKDLGAKDSKEGTRADTNSGGPNDKK
jgi:hypothetical protein